MFSRRALLLGASAPLLSPVASLPRPFTREPSAPEPFTLAPSVGGQIDWASEVAGKSLYSESAYLDMVSDDGETGFIARIGRYPTLGRSWLWGHVFDHNGLYSFTTEEGSSSSERTDLEAEDVEYSARGGGADFRLFRRGSRSEPRHFAAEISFRGYYSDRLTTGSTGAHPRHVVGRQGRGSVKTSLTAILQPGHPPASNLSGRTEVLGKGTCHLTVGGQTQSFNARGHFHEQTQERPRFVNPFVYATIRGNGFYSVAIKTENGAVGFAWIDDQHFQVQAFDIDQPQETASKRHVRLAMKTNEGDAARTIEAELTEKHLYSVPIYDGRRRGSLVHGTVLPDSSPGSAARSISGCVNDHLPARLSYMP